MIAAALAALVVLAALGLVVALAWACYGMERDARADRVFYAQLNARNARRATLRSSPRA